MRKWLEGEVLEVGTKVKFVSQAAREWLIFKRIDPNEIFTVLANKPDKLFCDVALISSSGKVIDISNHSVVSTGGLIV